MTGAKDIKTGISVFRGPLKTMTSLMVLGSFLFYALFADLAGALDKPGDTLRTGLSGPGAPRLIEKFDPSTFSMPVAMAQVTSSYAGNTGKGVMIIQDAHCNYMVQRSIAEMLGYLSDHYGADVVNLEGGSGEYDLSLFTGIGDADIRRGVTDYFLRNGILSGAEFFAVNNNGRLHLWGMEDDGLYIGNLSAYRRSLEFKPEAEKDIEDLEKLVNGLKERVFSPELKELDARYRDYRENRLDTPVHLEFLIAKASERSVPVDDYPNIALLRETIRIEKGIDFDKANREREALISELKSGMSVKELEGLDTMLLGFRDGNLTRGVFYGYLLGKARELGIPAERTPDFSRYSEYVEVFNKVDAFKAAKEVSRLETSVMEACYSGDDQRVLGGISGKLMTIRDLFNIRLTEEAHEYLMREKILSNMASWAPVLGGMAGRYGVASGAEERLAGLAARAAEMERFYVLSEERGEAFIRNLKFGPNGTAVIVTGGFHAAGLQNLLKRENISFVALIPSFREGCQDPGPYYRILSGGKDPVSEAMTPAASSLQVPSMYTALARKAWGAEDIESVRAAKYVVERIMATGRPLMVVMADGKRIRFVMGSGQIDIIRMAGTIPDGDDTVRIGDLIPSMQRGEVSSPGAEDAGSAYLDTVSQELLPPAGARVPAPEGIARLMAFLKAFIATDNKDVPRTAVIADLHGNMKRFMNVMKKVPADTEELIFLGDYMDRGSESLKLMSELKKLKEKRDIVLLMGNHDLLFIMSVMGDENAFEIWLDNQGLNVMEEMGYDVAYVREELGKAMPGHGAAMFRERHKKEFKMLLKAVTLDPDFIALADWMKKNLLLYHMSRSGGFFMHAGMPMDEYANLALQYSRANGEYSRGLAALAFMEKDMKEAFEKGDPGAPVLQSLLRGEKITREEGDVRFDSERTSPLWVRKAFREGNVSPELMYDVLPGKESWVLEQLGAAFFTVGHTPIRGNMGDIADLDGRIFFIDRYSNEENGVVMFNDAEGLKYSLKPGTYRAVMNTAAFNARRDEARLKAKDLLGLIEARYSAPSDAKGASTEADLIGKLFDEKGRMVTSVKVELISSGGQIKLTDGVSGEGLYDKGGVYVGPVALIRKGAADTILKEKALISLRTLRRSLAFPGAVPDTKLKILDGAIALLEKGELYVMAANDHGVLGASDISSGVPRIFLSSILTADEDIFVLAAFHEAAELYLARDPSLVPDGLDAHTFLRGASRTKREKGPASFRKGVQDELFGELNEDLSYAIEVSQEEYLTEDEARLLAALIHVSKGESLQADGILMDDRVKAPVVTPDLAESFRVMRERYRVARAKVELEKDDSMLKEDPYFKAFKYVYHMVRGKNEYMARYFEGSNHAMGGLTSMRSELALENLRTGKSAAVKILPTVRGRETLKVRTTAARNDASIYKSGAIVELPTDKEIILVGDLHGKLDSLKAILSHNGNLARIKRGDAILVILGDAVHPDPDTFAWTDAKDRIAKMKDMRSSVETMRYLMQLQRENPDRVFYILGNHDYLSGKVAKKAIQQGLEYRKYLLEHFGIGYVGAYNEFIASCPVMAMTADGLNVTHAGPIGGVSTLDDIRGLDVTDEDDPCVHQAMWTRWKADPRYYEPYDEEVVDYFLRVTGGKMLVVAHTKDNIEKGDFYAELMEGRHYVTFAASYPTGYLSYKGGKIGPVNVSPDIAEDETSLSAGLKDVVDAEKSKFAAKEEEKNGSYEERIKVLKGRFGPLKVLRTLGSGTFGSVFEVETSDGKKFALKIAGGVLVDQMGELNKTRLVVKVTDVAFGVLMKGGSEKEDLSYMPRIIDAGIYGEEPYVAMEVVEGYRRVDKALLAYIPAEEVLFVAAEISKICVRLKAKGLLLFDTKPENFGYKNGKVILLDVGSCAVNPLFVSREKVRELEKMGIKSPSRHLSDKEIRDQLTGRFEMILKGTLGENISRDRMDKECAKAQEEENMAILYRASGDVARDLRQRAKPVVVFLRQQPGYEAGQFSLIKMVEKTLRKKYKTENLRLVVYDGTKEGFDAAKARAADLLEKPGARAVAYVPAELHPGKAEGNIIYIKEDSSEDILSVVGPRVALALGIINYTEGVASPELLESLERAIKLMVDDPATITDISKNGLQYFLNNLLNGVSCLKMRKIDIEEIQSSIEMQETVLQSL